MKKVAFICVHNSCRSQIAEAFGKALASDVFESYSAGTETKPQINQDAVRLMKELYGIHNRLVAFDIKELGKQLKNWGCSLSKTRYGAASPRTAAKAGPHGILQTSSTFC